MLDCSIPPLQFYLRQQAIRLRKQGKRIGEIAHYLGVHRNTVSGWWQQYQQQGEATLEQQLRGNKLGEGRTLSSHPRGTGAAADTRAFPRLSLKIDSALWTRQAVCSLLIAGQRGQDADSHGGRVSEAVGHDAAKTAKSGHMSKTPNWLRRGSSRSILASRSVPSRAGAEIAWGDEAGVRTHKLKSVGVMHPLEKLRKFA